MENDVEFESLRNEVLKKIGWLVMSFQQMELLFKGLNTYGISSGFISELEPNRIWRENEIFNGKRYTLGSGIVDYKKKFLMPETNSKDPIKDEPWLSFKCGFELNNSFSKEKQETFDSLLADRNYLVHNLISDYDFWTYEGIKKVKPILDALQEKLSPEIKFLQAHYKIMQEGLKEHKEYLDSDEGLKFFELAPLRESLHVQCLIEYALNNKRPDGWVVLSRALNYINQSLAKELLSNEPFINDLTAHNITYDSNEITMLIKKTLMDDLDKIKKRYGFTKIEKILSAAEWFDIKNEKSPKGGIRVIYRFKSNLVVTDDHITWSSPEMRLNG